jgi:hypothetical protein
MKRQILSNSFILICLLIYSHFSFAQVSITQATGGTNICIDNPTSTSITDIVIAETTNSAISTIAGGTFVLTLTSGFQWAGTPTIGTTGSDLSNASVTITGSGNTALKVTFDCGNTSSFDAITLSNLKIFAVSPPPDGQAIIIKRPNNATGGNATITGSLNADYGILSSRVAPNSFITGLASSYCSNSNPVLLKGIPTVAGSSFNFTAKSISGPGTVTTNAITFSSGNYFFDPNTISGVNSITGTAVQILFSSTLPGGCVTTAIGITSVYGLPALDFTLPTDGVTSGNMRQSDVTFNLVGTPSGGNFSGDGVAGNVFDTRLVPTYQSIPVTYSSALNGCSASITKNITVVTATGILNLSSKYCSGDAFVSVSINGANLPQPFQTGVYELVTIIGDGINGTVNGFGTGGTFTFNPSSVPIANLNLPLKVKVITRKYITTAFVYGYYWSSASVSTCLPYSGIGNTTTYYPYQIVSLPYSFNPFYQLNNNYNYPGAPDYYCVGPTGGGAVIYHYDYKGNNLGFLLGPISPYWETQSDIDQNIIIFSTPVTPGVGVPLNSNCVGNPLQNYSVNNVETGAVVRWWDNSVTSPAANAPSGYLFQGASVNAGTGLSASNSSAASIPFKVSQERNGCISSLGTFNVVVYNKPTYPQLVSPTVSGSSIVNIYVCQYETMPTLSLTGSSGLFNWYKNSYILGNRQASDTTYTDPNYRNDIAPNTIAYFASQVVNGCESSIPLRINLINSSLPGYIIPSNYSFDYCQGTPLSNVSDITIAGSQLNNYINVYKYNSGNTTLVGSHLLTGNTNYVINANEITLAGVNFSVGGTSFYMPVSQIENGCESGKEYIYFSIQNIPTPPQVIPIPPSCNGSTPPSVTITLVSGMVNFFDLDKVTIISTTGSNVTSFDPPTTLTGKTGQFTYYFSQTTGVCTSSLAPATYNLSAVIPPPTLAVGTNPINTYCQGEAIDNFMALPITTSFNVKWKDASNTVLGIGNALVITSTGITSGIDYKAFQFDPLNGCESSTFTGVKLVVYAKPAVPGVTALNYFCSQSNPQFFLLNASTVAGNALTWYIDKNLTSILGYGQNLNSGVDLSNGDQKANDYYVTQTASYTNPNKQCESAAAKLSVTVNPTPEPVITEFAEVGRTGLEDTLCTNSIKSLAYPLFDKAQPRGGFFKVNGVLQTDFKSSLSPGLKRLRYFYTQTFTGISCSSDTSRYIRVLPLPDVNFNSGKLCVGDTVTLISLTSVAGTDQIIDYKWNVGSATRFSPDTLPSVKVVFYNPSKYDMSLSVNTKYGCSNTKVASPDVQSYPRLIFTPKNICLSDTTVLDSRLLLKDIFGTLNSYKYLSVYFGDGDSIRFDPANVSGTGAVASRTFGNSQKIKHIYQNQGVYYQKIVASSTNGCDTSIVNRFFILPKIKVTPGNEYIQDFESSNHGFVTGDSISSWQVGTPNKIIIKNAASGSKAWVTNLNGSYNRGENTAVRCPCFDYSAIKKPMISMAIRTNFPPNNVDGVVLQANDGVDNNWATVGNITSVDSRDAGINWYNSAAIVGNPGSQSLGQVGWSSDTVSKWRVARFRLDSLKDISQTRILNPATMRFRVAFGTSSSTVVSTNFDGFAFDDFSILERDKMLLVEHFTNSSGKTSKTDDQYLDDLTNVNRNDMVAIHYHTAFPGTDDFNTLNIADPSARSLFYGVDQVPYSVLSGNKYIGNTQALRQSIVDTVFLNKAKFKLTIDTPFATGGNTYSIKIRATAVSSVSDPTALYVALVERTVAGSNVTAANGQTNFEWVMRKLVPDAAGTSISDAWAPSTVKDFTFTSSLDKVFDAKQVGVIAFIQNKLTKEVYQSSYVGPRAVIQSSGQITTSIENSLNSESISLYPNPANDLVHIVVKNAKLKNLHWIMYDQLGKLVQSGILLSGTQLSVVNTSPLSAGVYILGFSDNTNATIYKKIVIIK